MKKIHLIMPMGGKGSRFKNKGWRIDYCMVSDNMKPKVKAAYILNDAVHSDHCPAVLEIE